MGSYSMWCNRPRMGLDGRKSTSPSSLVHVIFLTNTSSLEVRGFFALSHLASRLTPLFGELATGLHVHQRDTSLICSLFRPCRQALSAKATDRLLFALTKSQRTTTCQNATQHWLDLHLQRQPLIPLRISETRQAKNIVKAFCYLLCARYFLHARSCRGRGTSCTRWAGNFFFFWIRGSTDLRRFERILGGSGSIRVSVDSFYPYFELLFEVLALMFRSTCKREDVVKLPLLCQLDGLCMCLQWRSYETGVEKELRRLWLGLVMFWEYWR